MGLGDRGGQLAQRLAHQAGLQARQAVAHLPFDFRPGGQRRHGVDDDDVHRARAHQGVGDLQRLLAGVRLGDQELVEVDAQLVGVGGIQRMFGVDEGRGAAGLLDLGHHVQGQRRLAGAFRPVDLDDPPLGQAADPQRHVQAQRARRHRLDLHDLALVAQLHHRALAEGPIDLAQRRFQSALLVTVFFAHELQCHRLSHFSHASYPTIPPTGPPIRPTRGPRLPLDSLVPILFHVRKMFFLTPKGGIAKPVLEAAFHHIRRWLIARLWEG